MLRRGNSPVHRSVGLLCNDSRGRAQTVNRSSFGSPHCSRPLEESSVGERDSSLTFPTFMTPTVAPFQTYHPTNLMVPGYYPAPPGPPPVYPPPPLPPQFSGYYPIADSRFVVDPYDPFVPTYQPPDIATDVGGMFPEPLPAHQPPIPPAPTQSIQPNLAFHYHPCRWQGGPPCDGLAPGRNREMGEHLRTFHRFIGHERDTVQCDWENCGQIMQRMNIPRHIVSRHLLAAASCRFCGKQFSRPDVVGRHERTCGEVSPVSSNFVTMV